MVEIHRLTPGLGEEVVAADQSHVEPLPAAALAAVGGEDQLLQPSGARGGLAVVSLRVADRQTCRAPRYLLISSRELTSCNQDIRRSSHTT